MKRMIQMLAFVSLVVPMSVSAQMEPEPTDPGEPNSECTTDADCDAGESCVTVTTDCAPCLEEDPDCSCDDESFSYCEAGPPPSCDDSGSCPGDLVCVTYSFEECSGGGAVPVCAPDENCDVPDEDPEESCTSSTESLCVPKYVAPCQVDTDCGSGFTCEAVEICQCSAGSPPSDGTDSGGEGDGEDREPTPDEDCSCAPTGDMYCQIIEVACDTDSDCAQDLVCEDFSRPTVCEVTPDGDETCDTQEDVDDAYCVPEDFDEWGYGDGTQRIAEETGHSANDLESAERDSFFGPGESSGSGSKSDAGGCSTTPTVPSALWILVLGFAFATIRRRR